MLFSVKGALPAAADYKFLRGTVVGNSFYVVRVLQYFKVRRPVNYKSAG